MPTFTANLRSDAERALLAMGIVGAAADAILAETAANRAAWRADTALTTLLDAAIAAHDATCVQGGGDACACFDGPRRESDGIRRVAAAIGYADTMGVGGRMGVAGDATVRIPSLRGLGKGRKQARDGGAWTSAIETAAGRLSQPWRYQAYNQGSPVDARFAAMSDGGIVFGVLLGHDAAEIDADLAYAAGLAAVIDRDDAIPNAWLLTIAREGLRRAAGLAPWHETVPMYTPPSSLPQWAAPVNIWAGVPA